MMASRICAPSSRALFEWLGAPSLVLPVAGNYRDLALPLAGLDLARCSYQVQPNDLVGILQAAFAPELTKDPLPIPPPGGTILLPREVCDVFARLFEALPSLMRSVLGLPAWLGQAAGAPVSRDGVVALCREYVGGSVGDPKFEEVTQGRADAPRYSACGDLINFVLYRIGCRDPSIVNRNEPQDGLEWHVGENISRPVSGAKRVGAWVDYVSGLLPKPGDCALIGAWPDEIEHVFVVLEAGPETWLTADYGAVNSVGQQSSSIGTTTLSSGRIGRYNRKLIGWIDIDRVPRSAPAQLPVTGITLPGVSGAGGVSLPIVLGAAALIAAGITYAYWSRR